MEEVWRSFGRAMQKRWRRFGGSLEEVCRLGTVLGAPQRSGGQNRPGNCLKTCYKVPVLTKQISKITPTTDKRSPTKAACRSLAHVGPWARRSFVGALEDVWRSIGGCLEKVWRSFVGASSEVWRRFGGRRAEDGPDQILDPGQHSDGFPIVCSHDV